jgi:hypothetical protein
MKEECEADHSPLPKIGIKQEEGWNKVCRAKRETVAAILRLIVL